MGEIGFMIKTYRKDGTCILKDDNNKYGLIDKHGKIYLDCLYDDISLFFMNYAEIIKDGKVGLVNICGNIVLDCNYGAISSFDDNKLARVLYRGFEGLFTTLGTWLIKPRFSIIYPAFNDIYIVCKNDSQKEVDDKPVNPVHSYYNDYTYNRGQFYKSRDYDRFDKNNPYLKKEYPNGKYGIINSKGEYVVNCIYDMIFPFSESYIAVVKLNNKWGCIDEMGNIIVPIKYDCINEFQNGLASTLYNGKWGIINAMGETIVPFVYEKVLYVGETLSLQLGNNIYEFDNQGLFLNLNKEYLIPQFDMGYHQLNWHYVYWHDNLPIDEHFDYYFFFDNYRNTM